MLHLLVFGCASDQPVQHGSEAPEAFEGEWLRTFPSRSPNRFPPFALDGAGNAYVTHDFEGTVDFGDGPVTSQGSSPNPYVVKVDASGGFVWKAVVPFGGVSIGRMAVAPDGSLAITGGVTGDAEVFGRTVSTHLRSHGFVAVIDPDGSPRFVRMIGEEYGGIGVGALRVTDDGHVAIAGQLHGALSMEGTTYEGDRDPALLVLDRAGAPVLVNTWAGGEIESVYAPLLQSTA